MVTAEVNGAKITEAGANLDLQAEARTKLVALYREALSSIKETSKSSQANLHPYEQFLENDPCIRPGGGPTPVRRL
jgi:hypothetical protein